MKIEKFLAVVSISSRLSLSLCVAEVLLGFPVMPTVDLHALPSFAVLCQTTIL